MYIFPDGIQLLCISTQMEKASWIQTIDPHVTHPNSTGQHQMVVQLQITTGPTQMEKASGDSFPPLLIWQLQCKIFLMGYISYANGQGQLKTKDRSTWIAAPIQWGQKHVMVQIRELVLLIWCTGGEDRFPS